MISSQASCGGAVQTGMLWWKVELDKSGAILSVEQVADVAKGSKLVAYVQATTKADACTSVKEWFRLRRQSEAVRSARRRNARLAAGMCGACGKKPLSGKGKCQTCRDRCNERRRATRAGEQVLKTSYPTELEAFDAHRQRQREAVARHREKTTYCGMAWTSLLKRFDALGPETFRAWLVERIEKRPPLAEAAE